ncbi:MAG: hypothetical protein NC428_03470 [Clostridium sp.]|nr:hypothetical protein [Clostridium sp.]
MYCPKCGNSIADGSTNFCPVCGCELNNAQQSGFKLASEQSQNMNNQQPPNSGYGQGGGNPQTGYNPQANVGNSQPMYNPQTNGGYQQPTYNSQPSGGYNQPKKQNTGLIIGVIIGAVVLIAAIVFCLIHFVFKKDEPKELSNNDSSFDSSVGNYDDLDDYDDHDDYGGLDDYDDLDDDADGISYGTYSISSMRLEGVAYGYSDINSMGYGEMTLRIEDDYIYFKQTTDGYEVPYNYSDNGNGSGKMWNSVEEYTIYYTEDTFTIDFASSEDFADYTEYVMVFSK